jgi:glutathione S-transferase
MCEEHLYWLMIDVRWLDDANFAAGPAKIFDQLPAPIRPLIKVYVRRAYRKALKLQGIGRHEANERLELARRDLQAISDILADKPFLFGEQPHGADASVGAFVIGVLAKGIATPLRDAAETIPHLPAYGERITKRYFPDFSG